MGGEKPRVRGAFLKNVHSSRMYLSRALLMCLYYFGTLGTLRVGVRLWVEFNMAKTRHFPLPTHHAIPNSQHHPFILLLHVHPASCASVSFLSRPLYPKAGSTAPCHLPLHATLPQTQVLLLPNPCQELDAVNLYE